MSFFSFLHTPDSSPRKLSSSLAERDVGMGLLLDGDQAGRVFVEQLLPSSIAHKSGQVLPGDEIIEIDGAEMRGKHAREVRSHIASSNHSATLSMRLNRGGRILDVKMPRSANGMSMSLSQSHDASPSRSRGMSGGNGSDLAGIDQQVQRILRHASDDETRQLEENLAQSRRRHAARLQEELARNRSDSSDRLQLEIKVLRAEHAGLLEQKLAEIRQQHYQKIEEELDALRTKSAARLDQRIQESRGGSKDRLEKQLEKLRSDSGDKLHQQMVAERQRLSTQLLADREWLTMA